MSAKDSITTQTSELSQEEFNDFLALYPVPSEYRVILPKSNQTVFDAPPGYVGLYTHSFSLANLRLPLTEFFYEVLKYFQVHILRLNPFGCAKLTTFVVMCKAYGCEPSVDLFRGFFNLCRAGKWLTFAKRSEKHIPNLLPKVITRIEEMAFRNFIYTKDDEDLAFLPKDPSSDFGVGSPSISVNTEPLKANEEPEIQPVEVIADFGRSPKPELFVVHPGTVAARIKDRKCKTKGGSQGPLLRGSLLLGLPPPMLLVPKLPLRRMMLPSGKFPMMTRVYFQSLTCYVPSLPKGSINMFIFVSLFLLGLPNVLELKDANACHLKISAITPPAWKNHLDNHIDLELLDLHDRCYAKQAVVDNDVNRRSRELLQVIEKLIGECDARLEALKVSLRKEVKKLKQDRREVVLKVVPYAAMELVHNDEMDSLVSKLVSSIIVYERCRAFEQVADMKEPFDLLKVKDYRSSYTRIILRSPQLCKDQLPQGLKSPCLILNGLPRPRFQTPIQCLLLQMPP
ncbi:hypothetical protein Tco_1425361, partial [Tanacetum coccineum]